MIIWPAFTQRSLKSSCVSVSSNNGTNKTADQLSFASCTKHCWPLLVKNMNYSQRRRDRADIQRLSNSINRHATEHLFGSWRAWHLVWCRQVSSAAGWLTDAGRGPRCVHILMSLTRKYPSLWKLFGSMKVTPVCRFTWPVMGGGAVQTKKTDIGFCPWFGIKNIIFLFILLQWTEK